VFCIVCRFCDAIQIPFVLNKLFFLGYGFSCKPSQKVLSIAKNADVYPYCAKSVSFFNHNVSTGIYPITIEKQAVDRFNVVCMPDLFRVVFRFPKHNLRSKNTFWNIDTDSRRIEWPVSRENHFHRAARS